MEVEWTPTVERHDISSRARAHDDLVVFATSILPSHSSPELATRNVRIYGFVCTASDSHSRLVRIIDEAETLNVLGADVTSVAGLRCRVHVRYDPNLFADSRLGNAVSVNRQTELKQTLFTLMPSAPTIRSAVTTCPFLKVTVPVS